jgi:hypothetical protein
MWRHGSWFFLDLFTPCTASLLLLGYRRGRDGCRGRVDGGEGARDKVVHCNCARGMTRDQVGSPPVESDRMTGPPLSCHRIVQVVLRLRFVLTHAVGVRVVVSGLVAIRGEIAVVQRCFRRLWGTPPFSPTL